MDKSRLKTIIVAATTFVATAVLAIFLFNAFIKWYHAPIYFEGMDEHISVSRAESFEVGIPTDDFYNYYSSGNFNPFYNVASDDLTLLVRLQIFDLLKNAERITELEEINAPQMELSSLGLTFTKGSGHINFGTNCNDILRICPPSMSNISQGEWYNSGMGYYRVDADKLERVLDSIIQN